MFSVPAFQYYGIQHIKFPFFPYLATGINIRKLANYTLLVIDEWLTVEISKQHQTQLLELFEMRSYKGSTIICTLHPIKEWRQLLWGDTIAESIMDRITANKEVITFGDKNMRRWENEHRTN